MQYTYISLCKLLTELGSNDYPVAKSTHSTQVLVSKYQFLLKEPELLGRVVAFSAREGIIQTILEYLVGLKCKGV